MTVKVINGDARKILKDLPREGFNCCVTSPPYFGLRDYGHPEQIGLEQTPEQYIAAMVDVFRCVRDLLADDGTLWLNIGDSYAAQRGGTHQPAETLAGGKGGKMEDGSIVNRDRHAGYNPSRNASAIGLKHKDLIGIPWMLAFALRADGWYLRQDIIWHKPNPMPESVRDRCTKAHEYIFLMSKRERYFYDADAIAEAAANPEGLGRARNTRNRRSVWSVTSEPFSGAHFATFPTSLIEPMILAGCPKGGTVLDPFAGAGTTGLVADRLGRNAVLVELNAEYAKMAQRRISSDAGMFAEVSA